MIKEEEALEEAMVSLVWLKKSVCKASFNHEIMHIILQMIIQFHFIQVP